MRKFKVLDAVSRLAPPDAVKGATTDEIAKTANVRRQNASSDLNELWRDGLVRKSVGRPVQYWATAVGTNGAPGTDHQPGRAVSAFVEMIGRQGSLRMAVEQAQAAMLYPPRGLPTLIVGPTGSGKSHLAEMMYFYAVQSGRLRQDAPFHVFNCADYAHNPQLLLAQLFGYVKGSFTGATQTTPGLIAQTEHGVLFLDEIHRLPPEGQEMLFLLMDKGEYRMLGDGAVQRKASITLLAATSEDPYSALLSTLLRRFPVVISIPELNQRPLEERLALVELFLHDEATRVGIPISVSPFVLVALLTFHATGHVGALRSAILLGCAKAFLSYIGAGSRATSMPLYLTHLSPEIQLDYLRNHLDTLKAEQLVGVEDRLYDPGESDPSTVRRRDGSAASMDLYSELRSRMTGYLDSGLDDGEVQKLIQIDVDYYLRRLQGRKVAAPVVPTRFLEVVADFIGEAGRQLGYTFGTEAVTGLALHFATATRVDAGDQERTFALVAHCPREYTVVRALAHRLESGLDVEVTAEEMSFLALFLAAHRKSTHSPGIAVVVICHGDRTASSMADVANQLLGTDVVLGVDMPLDQSLDDTLQVTISRMQDSANMDGALLLVDMGSLTGFGVTIERAIGIPVAVIPLVTTAAVIEAGRLASEGDMDLPSMVKAVKQVYSMDPETAIPAVGKRVIITTCLTGQGTARKLALFLTEALPVALREEVIVQSVDLESGSDIPGLLVEGWRGSVVAAAGTVDPHLPGVPFVGMEQILFGQGIQTLISLAEQEGQGVDGEPIQSIGRAEAVGLASRFVTEAIEQLDGQRFSVEAERVLQRVEQLNRMTVTPSQAARWIIHCSFALERLCQEGLVAECNEIDFLRENHQTLLDTIDLAVQPLVQSYHVEFPEGEIGYLALIILS
ncbi:sigma 54-interacting transcriptional regulator [Alicyclobacillus fastidiosus]|uniref:Sigma 54-interacting transcriptional regulator n=1 Tax=Alicyclobacillus fastidiosus TaxID=392011 RepID=A0ABV5AAF4_9BACL|nr:sigma 54-interacting transcriptional regulator [Alicyclobacillus fastidiosus]WEH07674.1 sigma 54-interacting transcriptional regulator [Alicyclobacillus fastidiosus]